MPLARDRASCRKNGVRKLGKFSLKFFGRAKHARDEVFRVIVLKFKLAMPL